MVGTKSIALVTLLVFALAARADDVAKLPSSPVTDPDLGDRIIQAAYFDNLLWLLGAPGSKHQTYGALVSLDLATDKRTLVRYDNVIALFRGRNDLWELQTEAAGGNNTYSINRWSGSDLHRIAELTLPKDDHAFALADVNGEPAVLTLQAAELWNDAERRWNAVHYSPKSSLRWGIPVTSATADGSALYIGLDRGEWGGDLEYVDLGNRSVASVEKRGKNLCEGDFNSDCQPVTGLIADLSNPHCVLASVGLSHFDTYGRILRVCGTEVTVVYKNEHIAHYPGGDFPTSEPFFGLARADKGFWTVSYDAIYRFEGDKVVRKVDLPALSSRNGMWLSQALPGVIIVRTDANAGMSLSGYTPLIVPTDR